MPPAQDNRHFDLPILRMLASPERWKFVSSLFPPDIRPCARPPRERADWSRENGHSHVWRNVLMVLRGSGWFGYRDALYPARAGTVFFIAPFEKHDHGYPDGASDADHLWVFVPSEDRVFAVLHWLRGGKWRTEPAERWVFGGDSLGSSLAATLGGSPADGLPPEWRRQCCLNALHSIILRIVATGFQDASAPPAKDIRRGVVEYIQEHLRQTAGRGDNLDSLARMAGYSKFHLVRLFKRYTGHTVLEYVNQCRRAAVRHMREQGLSHRAMGEALGFSSPASFSRWRRTEGPPETAALDARSRDQCRSPS